MGSNFLKTQGKETLGGNPNFHLQTGGTNLSKHYGANLAMLKYPVIIEWFVSTLHVCRVQTIFPIYELNDLVKGRSHRVIILQR